MPQPANLIGALGRFLRALMLARNYLMHLRVVWIGEALDYRLAEILDDPRER